MSTTISRIKGHASMIGAEVLLGASSPIGKLVLIRGVTPLMLTGSRMIGAMVMFWLISIFSKSEKIAPKDYLRLFVASLICISLNQGLTILGLRLTSPVNASIIATSTPIITLVLAVIFLKDTITIYKVIGITIGAAGALILIIASATESFSGNVPGDLLVIIGQICFSSYLVFFKPLIMRYKPITLMKWMFTFSALTLLPFSASEICTFSLSDYSETTIYCVILFIIGPTFLSYLLLPIGQKSLKPLVVSMYNYLQPIIAVLISILIGLGNLSTMKVIAIIMVFIGVSLVSKQSNR